MLTGKQEPGTGMTELRCHVGNFIEQRASSPGESYNASKVHKDIQYTKEDDAAIDDWVAGVSFSNKPSE